MDREVKLYTLRSLWQQEGAESLTDFLKFIHLRHSFIAFPLNLSLRPSVSRPSTSFQWNFGDFLSSTFNPFVLKLLPLHRGQKGHKKYLGVDPK